MPGTTTDRANPNPPRLSGALVEGQQKLPVKEREPMTQIRCSAALVRKKWWWPWCGDPALGQDRRREVVAGEALVDLGLGGGAGVGVTGRCLGRGRREAGHKRTWIHRRLWRGGKAGELFSGAHHAGSGWESTRSGAGSTDLGRHGGHRGGATVWRQVVAGRRGGAGR